MEAEGWEAGGLAHGPGAGVEEVPPSWPLRDLSNRKWCCYENGRVAQGLEEESGDPQTGKEADEGHLRTPVRLGAKATFLGGKRFMKKPYRGQSGTDIPN